MVHHPEVTAIRLEGDLVWTECPDGLWSEAQLPGSMTSDTFRGYAYVMAERGERFVVAIPGSKLLAVRCTADSDLGAYLLPGEHEAAQPSAA